MMAHKSVVIIGASSGIGKEIAAIYAKRGWHLVVCARRLDKLKAFADEYSHKVTPRVLDVDAPDVMSQFLSILEEVGDVDIILNCAGIGSYNPSLDCEVDVDTVKTDCVGFTAIADVAFNFFSKRDKGGQFAAISSIAGVRSLAMSLSYSASKRFQNAYLEGLQQLARIRKAPIHITDIRPGFCATDLLDKNRKYPMLMSPEHVARLAVKAIDGKKRVAVIDWRYKILVALWMLIPRWLWVRIPIKFSL